MCISRATVSAVSCLVVPAFICIDLLISLVLKINDDDDDEQTRELGTAAETHLMALTAAEQLVSVIHLSLSVHGYAQCMLFKQSSNAYNFMNT